MSALVPTRALNVTLRLPVLSLREAKRQAILKALELSNWYVGVAAKLLGVSEGGLYRMMRDLGIPTHRIED